MCADVGSRSGWSRTRWALKWVGKDWERQCVRKVYFSLGRSAARDSIWQNGGRECVQDRSQWVSNQRRERPVEP